MNRDKAQYATHLVEFAENHWQIFLEWSLEYGYESESELEELNSEIRKDAEQVG